MTFRLLGIPEELRLEIEQSGGFTPRAAQIIIERSVQEAQAQSEMAMREIQSIVGPHGALSRVQAGGVQITPGMGVGVFADGVEKTHITPRGNLFIGSDLSDPATTTEAFFVEDFVYNNEEFGAGDFLIGDNSEEKSNVKWDASEGQWAFRVGTTKTVYMDTDGSVTAGGGDITMDGDGLWVTNQQAAFGFEDTNGDRFNIYIYSDNNNNLTLINDTPGSGITQAITLTDASSVTMQWIEDTIDNRTVLTIPAGSAGVRVYIGNGGTVLMADVDGAETVFNENSFDINFRIESAADTHAFYLDAGGELIQFFGGTVAAFDDGNSLITLGGDFVIDYGAEKRLEIGEDHYFPTRNSNNPNGFWNEANQDMDFTTESVNQAQASKMDAGLDKYTSLNWDGWAHRTETWTRTGNHTFTVPGDLTAIYRKGTKVRYNDGATEYGVIASSSHAAGTTTVTLIPNSDYAMAAATINDRYISYIDNPEGFPQWFNYTTTPSRSGTAYTNLPTINTAKWRASGEILNFAIQATMHATPGGTGFQRYTAPVDAATRSTGTGMQLSGAYGLLVFVEVSAPAIRVFKYDGTQEATASNIYFFNGSYEY